MGRGRQALGPREVSPTRGPGVGFPGVGGGGAGGHERQHREQRLGARLSRRERPGREPPAQVLWGSGCAQPGEERKTTGGEGGSGRSGSEGRGANPAWTGSERWGARSPGPSGSPRPGKSPSPWPLAGHPLPTHRLCPASGPGSGKGSGNPWRPSGPPFRRCRSHLPPPAAEWVGQPSLRSPPLLTRSVPPAAADPPSPPASRRSLHAADAGGKGESFRARKLPALCPPSSEPQPSALLPADRSPDRGCPALGTRSSSESVASSSFALAPLSRLFSSRGPRALPHPCASQARRPMLR